jgi:hypothetical protein
MKRSQASPLAHDDANLFGECVEKAKKRPRPQDAHSPMMAVPLSLDQLPPEIISMIVNGVDSSGRPLLDPRSRFFVRQVSHVFYYCVTSPSTVDTNRLRWTAPPMATNRSCEAWVTGRAASVASVVERVRSQRMSPDAAAAPYVVSRDPRCGWIAAWMVTETVDAIVTDFARAAMSLLPAPVDWFPLPTHRTRLWFMEVSDPARSMPHEIARRNLVCMACCLDRIDVLDGLLRWFALSDISTLCSATYVSAYRGNLTAVATMICHARRHMSPSRFTTDSTTGILIKTAAAGTAHSADSKIMDELVAWSNRRNNQRHTTEPLVPVEGHSGYRPEILNDLDIAKPVRDVACQEVDLYPYWASVDRADLFGIFAACRFDRIAALLIAVVSGSLAIEDKLRNVWSHVDFCASNLPRLIVEALERMDRTVGVPGRDAFTRGMHRMRERLDGWRAHWALVLADALYEYLDLAECVLEIWPPVPRVIARSGMAEGALVRVAIQNGHWNILGNIIRAYGLADDAAACTLDDDKSLEDNNNVQHDHRHRVRHLRRSGSDFWSSDRDSDDEDSTSSSSSSDDSDDDDGDKQTLSHPIHPCGRPRCWWCTVASAVRFALRPDGSLTVSAQGARRSLGALGLLCKMAYLADCLILDVACMGLDGRLFDEISREDRAICASDWSRWCGAIAPLPHIDDNDHCHRKSDDVTNEAIKEKKRDLVDRCNRLIALLDGAGLVRHSRAPLSLC